MKHDYYFFHEQTGDRLAAAGQISDAAEAYAEALRLKPQARWIEAKRGRLQDEQADQDATGAPTRLRRAARDPDLKTINLFAPYYTPRDRERAEELQECLQRNLDSGLFAKITLMIDDDTEAPRQDRRLSILRLDRRPSYLDWVRESRRRCMGQISILANSDIYFDDSLGRILEIFAEAPDAFVALSRYDMVGGDLVPHPDPHWSQDTWAFMPREGDAELHDQRLDIPLGVPRCDNKIAYVFATQGHQVFNPLSQIRSIHLHETGLRYYSKKGDRRVIGGMAMVHPGKELLDPAKLDFEIWSERCDQAASVKINKTLVNWAREAREAAAPRPRWLAHDQDWQYPAITERHAFERMRSLLTDEPHVTSSVYLGFPFATLIDLRRNMGPDHPRTKALQASLDELSPKVKAYERVFTVSQHIRTAEFSDLFAQAGVTDLFWSHGAGRTAPSSSAPGLRIHPFPLYPVQQAVRGEEDFGRARKWLFSFVGSHAPPHYLTRSRNHIIDMLGADPRGRIVSRDGWHYEKIVYETQIYGRADATADTLVNGEHSTDFLEIMDESTFSLCPSGSGPNSIRLWEAMVNGSIPVLMSDGWTPPGDPILWAAATVRCEETPEAIAALPDQLDELAADPRRIRQMRAALLELTRRYGPQGFVGDVIDLFET